MLHAHVIIIHNYKHNIVIAIVKSLCAKVRFIVNVAGSGCISIGETHSVPKALNELVVLITRTHTRDSLLLCLIYSTKEHLFGSFLEVLVSQGVDERIHDAVQKHHDC